MENNIGIVGGVGPYAGLALHRAILQHTNARRDQDYPPVISVSMPHAIADRTEYILGETTVNPAFEIIRQINALYTCGARYIGIPCNSAHAREIFTVIQDGVAGLEGIELVNMVNETFATLKKIKADAGKVGVLATKGSYKSKLFIEYGIRYECDVMIPEDELLQNAIHRSIYDPAFGIKVTGTLNERALEELDKAFTYYENSGIDTLILGCTELSVVFPGKSYRSFVLIDPLGALARKLISLYRQGAETK
jgi:aspartate racemase